MAKAPDIRMDLRFVEHGYEVAWEIDGKPVEDASGCKDFERNHSVAELKREMLFALDKLLYDFEKGK